MKLLNKVISCLFVAASLLMLVTGCKKDSIEVPSRTFRFPVNAKALNGGTIGGALINSMRLVVVNKADQSIAYNKSTDNGLHGVIQPNGSNYFTLELSEGEYTLYAIANESTDMTTALNAVVDFDDFKNVSVSGAFIENTIPFLGQQNIVLQKAPDGASDRFQISTDGGQSWKNELEVVIERTQCKVSLFLRKKTGTTEVVKIRSVELCRIPDKSYLISKPYDPLDSKTRKVFESADGLAIGDDVADGNEALSSYTTIFDVGEIFPEKNMIDKSDATKATYLRIVAEYGSSQTVYIVRLRNDLYVDNYNLTRNVHYNVYATITSTGEMGIYAVIVPTKIYDISVNWKPVEGLVVVSDREADLGANRNVWNDYSVYSGVLKVYNKNEYNDVLFKYGSLIAVKSDPDATTAIGFTPPTSASQLNDVVWFPSGYSATAITSWQGVPYYNANEDYTAGNTYALVMQGKGDPCRMAGLTPQHIENDKIVDNNQWHMASPVEYELLMRAANGAGSENDLGYRSFYELLLPNVKYRDQSGVLQPSHNGEGGYWSTSGTKAFLFNSQNPTVATLNAAEASRGYTVRCVRKTIPKADLIFGTIPSFTYQGSANGADLNVYSNLPYWKLELITSGAGIGTSTEFDDFSFAPFDANPSVHTYIGSYNKAARVYMKRKESMVDRTFGVKFTGIHFNGEELSHNLIVRQLKYIIKASMIPTPSFDNNPNLIPANGGAYKMHIVLTPADIAMPTSGEMKIELGYHGTLRSTSTTVQLTGSHEYDVDLVIPSNGTPDIIGIDFNCMMKINPATIFTNIGDFRNNQLP